ncbi:MAG TPA: tRNA (N6-isopentenyl adenosine(37)-C2)-methylthiotransferase MiaB [Caulobacteraceae bacterium]|nr:tRNA (N6-isopentenyl adenosine(37)-C2)-methylthiotransferase MiaB [Caulobacteraceae bacterium]
MRLHIQSFGCQMNIHDAERMAEILQPLGYAETASPDEADLVILNTCHIRQKAAEKVYSELGRFKALKAARRNGGREMLLVVAGCVAQAEGEEIFRRQSAVDVVVGPQAYHRLPELIARAHRAGAKPLALAFTPSEKFDSLPRTRTPAGPTAFVTIQEGCDRFCTFCVVPYTRGAEFSRPAALIEAEVRALVGSGVREVTLLGQNVNAWRGVEGEGLADLVEGLAEIEGLARIRYTTSHPADMSEALIAAHGRVDKLAPYLHLPVQSGSDRILRAMNRAHTAASYSSIIDRLRRVRPDIAVSGDFIVGFPGESDDDFEATMALAERVRYASAFSFKYSRRPGTPAAAMARQVPEPVKEQRLARLQALLRRQQQEFNRASVGARTEVLFERPGRHDGQIAGRSPYMQAVHCPGPASFIGKVLPVVIERAESHSLAGRILAEAA